MKIEQNDTKRKSPFLPPFLHKGEYLQRKICRPNSDM